MKKRHDPRHLRRIRIMQDLFANIFLKQKVKEKTTNQVLVNLSKIDEEIGKAAREWPIEKIAKIDLAILRLAVYELIIEKKKPPKVVIDEAVELAKEFGGESSGPFVNGVLGTIFKWREKANKKKISS